MERTYKARYYNGKSSRAYTVDISLLGEVVAIYYQDEEQLYVQKHWEKDRIREVEYASSIVTLRYGDTFPYEQLEITDPDFRIAYRQNFKVRGTKRLMANKGISWIALLLGGIALLLVLCYMFVLPLAADFAARSFPKEYEISMGKQMMEGVLQNQTIDSAKTDAINNFFQQMEVEGEYPVHIAVVKEDVVNAFALPGGGIVVYDKILKGMRDETELAALLSHEYSHIQLKHATRNMFRSLAGYLLISVLLNDVNGIAAVLVQNAETLRTLSYSRSLEQEADENGLRILQHNKIDPHGMLNLFNHLEKASDIQVNEILSTHPDLEHRKSVVETFMKTNAYTPQEKDSLLIYFNLLK